MNINDVKQPLISESYDSEWRSDDSNARKSFFFRDFFAEAVHQLSIGLPMVGMNLLEYSQLLVCLLFAGHISSTALASTAIGSSLANVAVFAFLDGLSSAMEPLCGQACGAKDYMHMGKIVQRVHAILTLICIPISFLLLFAEPILIGLHQDKVISNLASQFTRYLLPLLFSYSASLPLSKLLQVNELTFPLAIISAILLLIHISLNWIFIFYFKIGVIGTAIALSITDFFKLSFILLYLRFFDSKNLISLCWKNSFSFHSAFQNWNEFFEVAVPACAMVCLEWWFFEIVLILSGSLPNPEASIDAVAICFQIEALCYMLSLGMGTALSIRVSNELGAKDSASAKKAVKVGTTMAIIIGFFLCVFLLFFGKSCALLFTKGEDDPSIPILLPLLPSLSILKLFSIPAAVLLGALRGSGLVLTGAWVNGISYYFVGVPLASLFSLWPGNWGVFGFWMAVAVSLILQCLILSFTVYKIDWDLQARKFMESQSINDAEKVALTEEMEKEAFSIETSSHNSRINGLGLNQSNNLL